MLSELLGRSQVFLVFNAVIKLEIPLSWSSSLFDDQGLISELILFNILCKGRLGY